MEIKNKWIVQALYIPNNLTYYATPNGAWQSDIQKAMIFTTQGSSYRVNAMNKNENWEARKLPIYIKVDI